jgi:hypothetical protein
MKEHIEREALLELYQIDGPENETGHVPLPVIRQNIMDLPAADVAEVRRGRWEDKTNISRAEVEQRVDCSVCGQIFWTTAVLSFNYCPNCGALMKEDEHETG